MTTIYHNPRCSKSRQTLEILREKGVEAEVVEYLKNPPDAAELRQLLNKLGLEARQLLRKGEAEYREHNLSDPGLSDDEIIDCMLRHPKLIERPIVVRGSKAVLGRPPENVLELL